MSIINDALKKTQKKLMKKQPKKEEAPKAETPKPESSKPQEAKQQASHSGPEITNVYEKMYKHRQQQQDASVTNTPIKNKEASKTSQKQEQIKKWVQNAFVALACLAVVVVCFMAPLSPCSR